MREVDYLIAGGGGAGLGLALALLDSPLRDSTIAIIDRDEKNTNDRTWCFWGGPNTPFAWLAAHSWPAIEIQGDTSRQEIVLEDGAGWRYWMVRGIDYYRHARQQIEANANIRWIQGSVDAMTEAGDRMLVSVNGETIAARWVFDSIIRPGDVQIDPRKHHNLKQHFKGWEIETARPVFQPGRATLFDFRVAQHDDLRFFYVLPYSPTRALVEFTIFSAQLLTEEEYNDGLREYIRTQLDIDAYEVCDVEQGSIPMSDYPFARRTGSRVLHIGTKGGLVKPSTGYAFKRMQKDARAIVTSLVQNGHPFAIPRAPARYRFYDTLLLQILYRQGAKMKPIFLRMFWSNPILRIFHFLDEDASLLDDLRLIASLPPWPFLRALLRVKLLRKI